MIQPKHAYSFPTVYVEGMKEDTTIKNFIHCYIPEVVPIGEKRLWSIEYPVKAINVKHEDSSNLLLELATMEPNVPHIGDKIVSRIVFKSAFVLNVYKKLLSIEVLRKHGIVPLLQIRAYNRDLECAFNELFELIQGREGMILDSEHRQQLDPHIFSNRPNILQAQRVDRYLSRRSI